MIPREAPAATDAINALALSQADRARFVAHIAVADAVCYIFGYAAVIVFVSMIAPALLKIDLRTEALKLELGYFVDCILKSQTPSNNGAAGLRGTSPRRRSSISSRITTRSPIPWRDSAGIS